MSDSKNSSRLMAKHLLVPFALLVFAILLQTTFQMTLIVGDRDRLNQMHNLQNKPFQESQSVQAQFSALARGTQQLAESGNTNARPLYEKLKQLGILASTESAEPASTAPVPAATDPVRPSPEKP